jgi:hypothetical protein
MEAELGESTSIFPGISVIIPVFRRMFRILIRQSCRFLSTVAYSWASYCPSTCNVQSLYYSVINALKKKMRNLSRQGGNKMTEPIRISVGDARQNVSTGAALLVCAYDDDEKFKNNHLQGAISLNDFRAKLPSLSTEQDIIFYCA